MNHREETGMGHIDRPVQQRSQMASRWGRMLCGSCLIAVGCSAPSGGATTGHGERVGKTSQALTWADQSIYVLGKCLDVPGWNDANGTNIQIYDCTGGSNQQWEFWYDGTVRPSFNTNKCLDLPGWQTANGTPIQIYDCDGGANQQWTLGGGLRGYGSKCVDVPGYQTDNGTNLQYYDCNNGGNQKLIRTPPEKGSSQFWNLKAAKENTGADRAMCMGIAGGVTGGVVGYGTYIIVWDCNSSPDQQWFRTYQSDLSWGSRNVDLVDGATAQGSQPVCLWANDTTPVDGEFMRSQFCPDLFGAREDFVMNYVETDPFGYPCFTLQNPDTGLYVSVAGGMSNPIQNGMNVSLRSLRASSNYMPTDDQIWCDHSANTGTFTQTPDYVVANVIYAPPGKSSSIAYQKTTTVGSTLTTTKSFQDSTDVTATVGGNALLTVDSASVTYNHTFGNSETNQVDMATTWGFGYKKPGQVDGINHDDDEIWVLVHPILQMSFTPNVANGPPITNWEFTQGDGGTTDIMVVVYAGQLDGHYAMDQGTQDIFDRNSITSDMYPAMLQADAFFQGIAPQPFKDSSRFDYRGEYSIKALPPDANNPGTTTVTVTQSTTSSDMTTSSYSDTVGFSLSGGFNFDADAYKAQLTVTDKWTWSHSSSKKDSTGNGSMDTLVLTQPPASYTGPAELHVYEDRIFKTYAFMLDNPAPISVTYDGSTGCQVDGVSMHCCPSGTAMAGVRLDWNVFKCVQLDDASGQVVADFSTYRTVNGINADGTSTAYYVHTCPPGYVMVGLHADRNVLACRQISASGIAGGITGEVADTGTQDSNYPMHACESTSYAYAMSGFDGASNLLTCATNPGLR